jgi:pSer/pThr/pTyr-binding forkhead associated (FHA) protein
MPYLSTDTEHCELRFGANLLGGRSEGSVHLGALTNMPPCALILVRGVAGTVIRRLASPLNIRVDGEALGAASVDLADNSHIELNGTRLVYHSTHEGLTTHTAERPVAPRVSAGWPLILDPQEASPWILRELRTGRAIPIPRGGMLIGRSEECQLIVAGRGVSRRHALLEPGAAGFTITDESSNGTLVNGSKSRKHQNLNEHDIVRIGEEDYRVENSGAIQPATSESQRPTEYVPWIAIDRKEIKTSRPPEPLASLEVTRGKLRGTYFSIEKPVCSVGSGEGNDVRLIDLSVDSNHATLLRKGAGWFVSDLRSKRGTYVDGYRVAGERSLAQGCSITIGDVVMVFRARASQPEAETERRRGFLSWIKRLVA